MLSHPEHGPYIGMAGIVDRQQVEAIIRGLPSAVRECTERGHPGRCLAIGILVSDKTLAGIPVRAAKRHPRPDAIPDIWDSRVFNTLHYHTADRDANLLTVARRCKLPAGGGMQLNIVWPNPARVAELVSEGIKPILQVSRNAVCECSSDPDRVLGKLDEYRTLSYVLADLSGGKGIPITADDARLARAIYRGHARSGLVVAGGLGPGSLFLLDHLYRGQADSLSMRWYVSVDAESGLRNIDDELVVDKCHRFALEALRLSEWTGHDIPDPSVWSSNRDSTRVAIARVADNVAVDGE